MPDLPSRVLDGEILAFIRRYSEKPAPEMAFEWLALKLFRHQFANNRHYRKYCEFEKWTPATVRSWKEIPAMPALAFKELVLASFPIQKKVRIFRTSGTTLRQAQGKARDARGAHFFDTLRLYEEALLPPFAKNVLGDGAELSFYFLVSSVKEAPDSSLSYMMDVIDRRLARGKGSYFVRERQLLSGELATALTKEKKKAILLSTAFALKAFIDHLSSSKIKIRLAAGSRVMETGGFKGRMKEISKNELYALCARYLGVPRERCVSEYGMTELSSQMYGPDIFSGPSWLRSLVIDPRTGKEAGKGKSGLLRHFDLANRGSVLAVQTEDIGRAVEAGFKLIGRASGAELRGCSLSYEEFLRKSG